jgi:hypothetical protein
MWVAAILALIIIGLLWAKFAQYSGATVYNAECKASYEKHGDIARSIRDGLRIIVYRAPFDTLDSSDIDFIAETFARYGLKGEQLSPMIVEADKKRTTARMKNRQEVMRYVEFLAARKAT